MKKLFFFSLVLALTTLGFIAHKPAKAATIDLIANVNSALQALNPVHYTHYEQVANISFSLFGNDYNWGG